MTGLDFSIWLALVACVVGAVRIGLLLAETLPAASDGEAPTPLTALLEDQRLIGVAILFAHAGSAAVLGYGALLGHGMALTLSLGWLAAAAGRFWSARKLGQQPRGAVVELLIGLVLALPAWSDMARLARGAII
jgi:hypothetical protein